MENELDFFDFGIDDSVIRAERQKARVLRKTRWWQQKKSSGICHYCQQQVAIKELTMDHVIPLSRGGRSAKGNLVPCCKACNTAKKTALPPGLEEL
ncbi:MAG: HNH endonuclease [Candidatus Electrothrix sp. AR3]|nr:HNH endonuclease [Candidatus Electrothrix sp. AR3]